MSVSSRPAAPVSGFPVSGADASGIAPRSTGRLQRPLALGAFAVATALVLAGCSNEPDLTPDQEAAEKTSRTFLEAVVNDDAEAACTVMAFDGTPIKDDETLLAPCVTGIEESPTPQRRRNVYTSQLKEDPVVGPVKGDKVNVTWGEGKDATEHTMVKINGEWLLTQ